MMPIIYSCKTGHPRSTWSAVSWNDDADKICMSDFTNRQERVQGASVLSAAQQQQIPRHDQTIVSQISAPWLELGFRVIGLMFRVMVRAIRVWVIVII